ncbi:hypothetical protein [Calidifontibacter terrae]
MSADALKSAMDQLYAAEPAGFIALRKKLAADLRSAGEKETAATVAGLRKPTVAAALINDLARESEPPAIPELSDLGERMRAAQSAMDTGALKGLAKERSALVDDLVGRMGEPTAAVREQLADTLIAALADEQAEAAVTSGHLVNPLSYSGFGEVEVSDAVAVPLRELQDARLQELAEREKNKVRRSVEAKPVEATPVVSAKPEPKPADRKPAAKKPDAAAKAKPVESEPEPPAAAAPSPVSAVPGAQPTNDPEALYELVDAAVTAEREALAAVDAARAALAAAKDHAAQTTRARQLAEDLLDRAREA